MKTLIRSTSSTAAAGYTVISERAKPILIGFIFPHSALAAISRIRHLTGSKVVQQHSMFSISGYLRITFNLEDALLDINV